MAQFDVYPHPVEDMRDVQPYVVDIQSQLIRSPIACITIPLARLAADTLPMSRLNPRIQIGDEILVLDTLFISSFDSGELRRRVANLSNDAQTIWDALDFALHGY
jgi:toxin CcdB